MTSEAPRTAPAADGAASAVASLDLTRRSPYRARLGEALRRSPVGALVILTAVVLSALLADVIAPHDPAEQDISIALQPPAWSEGGSVQHLLGTDQLGRDILSRIIHGSRVSLLVGFATVAVSGAVGTTLGLLAGYFGRWWDTITMRITDIWMSMPPILLALVFAATLGSGLRNVIIIALGQVPYRLEIGLGQATVADAIASFRCVCRS